VGFCILGSGKMISVDRERCIGCGICEQVCPAGILRLDGEKVSVDTSRLDECKACRNCEISCPAGCISINRAAAAQSL